MENPIVGDSTAIFVLLGPLSKSKYFPSTHAPAKCIESHLEDLEKHRAEVDRLCIAEAMHVAEKGHISEATAGRFAVGI